MHQIFLQFNKTTKRICSGFLLLIVTANAFAHFSNVPPTTLGEESHQHLAFSTGFLSHKVAKTDVVPNEIWSRVRTHFHLAPPTHSARYQRHIKQLSRSPATVNALVNNASPYLYYILGEVEKRGMPSEIALLPMIESTFDPGDRSHKGAVGLWQLMPALGRHHGLKQSSAYDGRRDVYESTQVALDHLEYLHKRFNGNWLLALAAYNSGEFRVLKAMKQNRAAHKPTDYWSLHLPKETMDYVPKLLAWVEIVRAPKAYGLNLPNIPNKPVFTRLNTGKPVDMTHAAKLSNISETQLRKLNPGFKKSMDPNGPFHLVVPIQQAGVLQAKLGAKPAVVATKASKKTTKATQVKTTMASVKTPAEEIKASAAELKVTGTPAKVTAAEVKATTTPPNAEIKTIATSVEAMTTKKSATSAKKATVKTKAKAKMMVKSKSSSTPSKIHVVKKGESIPKICQRYGVSIKSVLAKNGLKSQGTVIRPGQKLKV